MLLPHKHVRFGSSLLAIAGYARKLLNEPRSIDELWSLMDSDKQNNLIHTNFTQLVLAVDVLFSIGEATSTEDGRIALTRRDATSKNILSEAKGA